MSKTLLRWSHAPCDAPCDDPDRLEVGLDEAGRGALCGPVFAAAVVWGRSGDLERERALREDPRMRLVRDSKKLSPAQRDKARAFIEAEALAWGVASVDAGEIDRINVLKASMRAMRLSLDALLCGGSSKTLEEGLVPGLLVVDGDRFEGYVDPRTDGFVPYACVPEADSLYLSVAAASILAKTHRDELVVRTLHPAFPIYGWDRNKGYGTAAHIRAIAEHGACPHHRRSFAPIKPKFDALRSEV